MVLVWIHLRGFHMGTRGSGSLERDLWRIDRYELGMDVLIQKEDTKTGEIKNKGTKEDILELS